MATKELISVTPANAKEIFEVAYDHSYYTIIGCGGDLTEWIEGYKDLLKKDGIGTPERFITFKGRDMNAYYGLSGSNAYNEDLTFIAFSIKGLDTSKLAIFRLYMVDKWFDDVVDNNAI